MKLNKMILPAILALVIGLGITACTGTSEKKEVKPGVEYYRSLQFSETPYDTRKVFILSLLMKQRQ